MSQTEPEPRPLTGDLAFEPWDFESLGPGHNKSPEANEYRLKARRKLLSWTKAWAAELPEPGLDVRTSIHNPHAFNGMRVDRLWSYAARTKKEKTALRKVLGRDLAKDLDAAYRNVYLCLAIEHQALEVSLRIHPDGWYDGQNMHKRVAAEGLDGLLTLLRSLDGFTLRLHDWKGRWPLATLKREELESVLKYYQVGELGFVVEQRWPVPTDLTARAQVLAGDVLPTLHQEWARLWPLYQYIAWSPANDFLFS
ncbi:MAG: hypothetical protein R3F17_05935 [Planctomycetota bacterium]